MDRNKTKHFFSQVLKLIQSDSIRAWASSERNAPHVLRYIEKSLEENPKLNPQDVATFLVITAMG